MHKICLSVVIIILLNLIKAFLKEQRMKLMKNDKAVCLVSLMNLLSYEAHYSQLFSSIMWHVILAEG